MILLKLNKKQLKIFLNKTRVIIELKYPIERNLNKYSLKKFTCLQLTSINSAEWIKK